MGDIAGINSGIVVFVLIILMYMIADTIYEIPEGVKIFVTVLSTVIAVGYFGYNMWDAKQKGKSLFTSSHEDTEHTGGYLDEDVDIAFDGIDKYDQIMNNRY